MGRRDVYQASRLLSAWRRGEETPEAIAGGMFEAAYMLAWIPKEGENG